MAAVMKAARERREVRDHPRASRERFEATADPQREGAILCLDEVGKARYSSYVASDGNTGGPADGIVSLRLRSCGESAGRFISTSSLGWRARQNQQRSDW